MRDDTLEKVCEWAISHSLATGHADTLDELLAHLGEQVEELRERIVMLREQAIAGRADHS